MANDDSIIDPPLVEISESMIQEAKGLPFVRRQLFDQLEPPKQNAIILKGARGVGKSTVILQFLASRAAAGLPVLYISADSFLLKTSLVELAMEYSKRGGVYLAIDEIHRYVNWQQEVKTILDSFSRIKLILSGSSSLKLDYAVSDLSRRHVMIHTKGLSLREYIEKRHKLMFDVISLKTLLEDAESICRNITGKLTQHNLDILQIFKNYLRDGYFVARDNYDVNGLYYASLINTINSVIDSDIAAVHNEIDSVARDKIKLILRHVSNKCPFTPNITAMSRDLNISNDNVLKKYLFYLDEAEVLINLYSKDASHKDFQRPQKIFLSNTNYIYAFSDTPDVGAMRETFVANCLINLGSLTSLEQGDFCLNNQLYFEVGGKNKGKRQIKGLTNAYVLADNTLWVEDYKLPLWLLGFLW